MSGLERRPDEAADRICASGLNCGRPASDVLTCPSCGELVCYCQASFGRYLVCDSCFLAIKRGEKEAPELPTGPRRVELDVRDVGREERAALPEKAGDE